MKQISFFWLIGLAIIVTSQVSCKKIPNGGVPIYLEIDSVSVNGTLDQGSTSHKITDVWVTANGENRGVYPLPAKIPILASGDVRFIVSAGIKDNGQSGTRAEYTFYGVNEFVIAGAESGKKYKRNQQFTYLPSAKLAMKEDFEVGNQFTNITQITTTTNANVFEGGGSGKMSLGANDTVVVAYNTTGFPITGAGREVYVEMDYKCDAYFEMGLITTKGGTVDNRYKITISPKTEWNKIYINISNEVGTINADTYRLYFKTAKPNDGSTIDIYFDNLKVVEF